MSDRQCNATVGLPLNLDHEPADYAEAVEMLRRARQLIHGIEQEVHRVTGNEGDDDVLAVLRSYSRSASGTTEPTDEMIEAAIKAGPIGDNEIARITIRRMWKAMCEAAPSTLSAIEPSEEAVEASAKVIAESPLIDSPKLTWLAWCGLAREILRAGATVDSAAGSSTRPEEGRKV